MTYYAGGIPADSAERGVKMIWTPDVDGFIDGLFWMVVFVVVGGMALGGLLAWLLFC
jgi:hypothetical protein